MLKYSVLNVELSATEYNYLKLFLQGKSSKEVGQRLFVTEKTAKSMSCQLHVKFNVTSRLELLSLFIDRSLLEPRVPPTSLLTP